ncbi:hypothetical protein H9P43_006938 [Blastocladiella emersonii ATCC 22665]|nr:hypothetical protein H9P43_006938 [Blastocladiella emersonii ATCC 22665]
MNPTATDLPHTTHPHPASPLKQDPSLPRADSGTTPPPPPPPPPTADAPPHARERTATAESASGLTRRTPFPTESPKVDADSLDGSYGSTEPSDDDDAEVEPEEREAAALLRSGGPGKLMSVRQRVARVGKGKRTKRAEGEDAVPIPWRALVLTVFLLAFGALATWHSVMLFLGYSSAKDPEKWKPLAVMGSLALIPGTYYGVYFALALAGVPGWDLAAIPEL